LHLNTIQLKGSISPGEEEFLKYAINRSEIENAQLLIVLLDTPGGLVTSMRGMAQAILNSSIPIVVFVYPSGAQAASAGVFVTAAADVAAMAPGTNIGAAHPVTAGGGDVPSTMSEKVLNDMLAYARSIAAQRGRNAEWLEDAVRKSVSATAHEAYALNVIDLVASDLDSLLKELDGWQLTRKGQTVILKTKGVEVRNILPDWRHHVLRGISNPNIAYILLMIGLAGLYFELSQPGSILPGVVGAMSLILALYAMQTLPVNYAGFLFILLALVLFIAEIKVASYGLLSLAGVLCLILGSLMLFRFPGQPMPLALSVLVPTVITISAFFIGVTTLALRAQRSVPKIGNEAFVGLVAEVVQDLSPEGKVFVNGELWNALADEPIPAGTRVTVVSVENLKLQVRRIDDN
jgi:membrane-bound serine protease (ClpP class)